MLERSGYGAGYGAGDAYHPLICGTPFYIAWHPERDVWRCKRMPHNHIPNKTGQNRPSKLITNSFLTLLQSVNKGGITKFRVDLKLFLRPFFAPSNITYSDDASLTAPLYWLPPGGAVSIREKICQQRCKVD